MSNLNLSPITFSLDASAKYEVKQHKSGKCIARFDDVAEEVPVALVYNGVSHAVMLATPQDLEDFALGFSLSEGILETPADLYGVEIVEQLSGIELHLDIATHCFQGLKEKRRSMAGRTGCGLCGSESLAQALRMPSQVQQDVLNQAKGLPKLDAKVLALAFSNIREQQILQATTGATHASAFVSAEGQIVLLREDVGRHNALDKLIGALKSTSHDQSSYDGRGFVFTTSRASYEMVQKTVSAGIPMLVAISAPTGLAIRVAEHYGITLVGFVREHSYVVYCDANNILV